MMAWSPGHLAILILLLGNLPHIVITVLCVFVVKDDRTTCRGQSLKSYLFKKKLQTDRIHKYFYIHVSIMCTCLTRSHTFLIINLRHVEFPFNRRGCF